MPLTNKYVKLLKSVTKLNSLKILLNKPVKIYVIVPRL